MADFDEYDYLERQLEGGGAAAAADNGADGVAAAFGAGEDAAPSGGGGRAVSEPPAEGEDDRRRSKERRRDKEKDKEKGRDRDKDRDRKRDSRSRSRERSRRDDRERKRSRSRDKDRSRRDDRDKDREREKERDRPYDSRGSRGGYERYEPRRRERTPPEARAAREAEKELREMERSTRTAFAHNLSLKADERDIYELFSKVGKVVDIKLITDKTTKRSKGFAYIEFSQVEEVIAAVSLTGQPFMGQTIMVKSSEHEKNLAWEAQQQAKQGQLKAAAGGGAGGRGGSAPPEGMGPGPCKLYVANLNPLIAESDVQQLFSPFGTLEFVQLVRDATGQSQGYGYVQFTSTADATKALQHWNGREVAGVALKVSVTSVIPPQMPAAPPALPGGMMPGAWLGGMPGMSGMLTGSMLPPPPALPGMAGMPGMLPPPPAVPAGPSASLLAAAPQLAGLLGMAMPSLPGMPAAVGALPSAQQMALPPPPAGPPPAPEPAVVNSGIGELDEEESRGGLKLTSDRRQALMAKLASSAGMAPPAAFGMPGGPAAAPPPMAVPLPAPPPAGPKVDPSVLMIQSVLGPASPIPTPCLLIKNMFSPEEAQAPGFKEEIEGDVRDECSKYGPVVHVHVDCNSQGCVYLKYATTEAAAAAQHAMHGRWFAGRQLAVDFCFAHSYAQIFGA